MNMHKDIYGAFIESASGWDFSDKLNAQYYDAELKMDLAPFSKGDVVDTFVFSLIGHDHTCVQIYHGDKVYEYPVTGFQFTFGEVKESCFG